MIFFRSKTSQEFETKILFGPALFEGAISFYSLRGNKSRFCFKSLCIPQRVSHSINFFRACVGFLFILQNITQKPRDQNRKGSPITLFLFYCRQPEGSLTALHGCLTCLRRKTSEICNRFLLHFCAVCCQERSFLIIQIVPHA